MTQNETYKIKIHSKHETYDYWIELDASSYEYVWETVCCWYESMQLILTVLR